MKKILYISILFSIQIINSQYYYKVEADITITPEALANRLYIFLVDEEGNRERIFAEVGANVGNPDAFQPVTYVENFVVESPNVYTQIRYEYVVFSCIYCPEPPPNVYEDSFISCYNDNSYNTGGVEINKLRVISINDVDNILDRYDNNEWNGCDDLTFNINNCNTNLQYGVNINYQDFTSNLIAYGEHPFNFSFDTNDLAFIDSNTVFELEIVYSEDVGNEFTDSIILEKRDCSIEHSSLTTEDETCAGSGDGKIRLGFEDDVEEGYFMRYYIYQGNADDFVGNVTDSIPARPTDVYEDVNFRTSAESGNNLGPLQLNPDTGEYEGEYSGLAGLPGNNTGQPYYIVYQEVEDLGDTFNVKSGNITETFYIRVPSALSVSTPVFTQPECAGDKGTIGFNVSGGGYANTDAARYYYSVDSGGGFVDWTESTTGAISIPNLNAGTYNIKVVAGNSSLANTDGCHVTLSDLTIAAPVPLGFDLSSSPESYPGANDGTVSVNNITGRAGMTLSINTIPEQSLTVANRGEHSFTSLPSGIYTVTLSAGTCTYTDSIEVTGVTLPVITVNSTTADNCDPAGAGSVDFGISGGVGDRPYRVLASDGTTVIANGTATDANAITVNNLVFDTYTIQAVNQGNDFSNPNLISSAEFTIDSGANIEISNVATTVINCFGGTSTLTFDTNLGTAAEYYLDTQANPDLTTVTWTTYDVAGQSGLTAGTYYLWVRSTTDTS
ncbi:collagen binding domain-containing protein, partial [Croceivirga sp. JEA036]|uniref:MSCRAMM family protein n=1 Tax=Croceivirga sp. JEA036 TaxID=2721162 RepID=UPI0014391021